MIANRDALLAWYDANARLLPWRAPPGSPPADPYAVWLSEIMLQQTTVAAVAPFYRAFLARWPTVQALAAAPQADVLAAWAGLGYYSRARNLHACAQAIMRDHGGRFPADEDELRRLPGIGAYTAAAIAAIAFGRPAAVVDGNVERVFSRLLRLDALNPALKQQVRQHLAPLVPPDRPGDFAQALMDVGATICTPRQPRCLLCPLSPGCQAYRSGDAQAFPRKPAKALRPRRHGIVYWLEADGQVRLERRADKGLLGGMLGLPGSDWTADPPALGQWPGAPIQAKWRIVGSIEHVFTHFGLTLQVARARADKVDANTWVRLDEIDRAGMPTVFRKAADLVRRSPCEPRL